jgi:hypothetical protein
MPAEPIDYAPGNQHLRPRWQPMSRRVLRASAAAILLVAVLASLVVSHRYPWLWYGSRDAYQRQCMLTFTMSPDKVVYEEDPIKAARLATLPRDPSAGYFGNAATEGRQIYGGMDSDYRLWDAAEYVPPFFISLCKREVPPGLVFIHERKGASGRRRLVWVTESREYSATTRPSHVRSESVRNAVWVVARPDPMDSQSRRRDGSRSRIRIPLRPEQVMRLYGGQVDRADSSHFTIKYEIDGFTGVIDGRVGADDTVALQILDGPAAVR